MIETKKTSNFKVDDINFEKRKKDHIEYSLDPNSQWEYISGLANIQLLHDALPELDFSEIEIGETSLGYNWNCPIFVSSMTAGNKEGERINEVITDACSSKNWLMGVGSQRKELFDSEAAQEWKKLKISYPKIKWAANLGITQLIQIDIMQVEKLLDNLEAVALFIHLNPLQESLQLEGTPHFRGGVEKIITLTERLKIPIIVKEVGCGISEVTAMKLRTAKLTAIDVSGLGGTHWGRIENLRTPTTHELYSVGQNFKDWGIDTVESLLCLSQLNLPFELWASGGVRSGVDVAKLIALGAKMVGVAQPFLKASLKGVDSVIELMNQFESELKIAMFCTGIKNTNDLRARKVWKWKNK